MDLQDTTVLYPLPKTFDLRQKWLSALKLSEVDTDASPNAAICSKHLNIPAFARCISESEEVAKLMVQSSANSAESETRQVMTVAKLVQKRIHDKLIWKHRSQFGKVKYAQTITKKSQKPAVQIPPDVAFVNCHIPHGPKPTLHGAVDSVVTIPDDIPSVPKAIKRIEPEMQFSTAPTDEEQNKRDLKALNIKLLSNLQKLPNLSIRKPPILSDQAKCNVLEGSFNKTTYSLYEPDGVTQSISTSKPQSNLRTSFYIDRQGKKKSFAARKRPAIHSRLNKTSAIQPPTSQKQTTTIQSARTHIGPNPKSQMPSKQTITNQTPRSKAQTIQAPTDMAETRQTQTTQMLGSSNMISNRTATPTSARKTPNNQSEGRNTRLILAPAAKLQLSQAPPKIKTISTVTRTFTGPPLKSQRPSNQALGSVTSAIQAPPTKQLSSQVRTAQTLGKNIPTNRIAGRTSTGPTPIRQTFIKTLGTTPAILTSNNQTPGSETRAIQAQPTKTRTCQVPRTQTLGSMWQTNQTIISQTSVNKTQANQTTGCKNRSIQLPAGKAQTSRAPTSQRLVSKPSPNQAFAGPTPTSQTSNNQMTVSKTPARQTLIRTSSTKNPKPINQPPTIINNTPSSHTLTRTSTNQYSSSTIQITQKPASQALGSKISAVTQTPTNNTHGKALVLDKLIDLQNKCGIVISKLGTSAIWPPSTNTSVSSKTLVDENVSVDRKSEMPNILKKQCKNLHLKRKQEFKNRPQKLTNQKILPTEPIVITIDDDVPKVEVPTQHINSVLQSEATTPLLPMDVVPRSESFVPPKPQARVEPIQLISVVNLLAKPAIIVIDDDDDPIDEKLSNIQITNNEVIAQPVAAEIAKESSITLSSEKPAYTEEWLDGKSSKIQNAAAKVICVNQTPPIQCEESIVESSSDSIKVAVSAIRLEMANKIADELDKLDKLLDPICEPAEDGITKKKRTKFQCDNCLQIFYRLYKLKRHIFLSSLDPSECVQQKTPTIDSPLTVEMNPIIGTQSNEVQSDDCENVKVDSSNVIADNKEETVELANYTEKEANTSMSIKNIQVTKESALIQGKIYNEKTIMTKRPKIVAKRTTTTVMKGKYTKRQAKKSSILTQNIRDEENYDSDATTLSVTSNSQFADLDVPRIELINGDGHAMVEIPQYSSSINSDFEQWINSLAPNTEVKIENQTKITPANKQTNCRQKKSSVPPRERRLRNLATRNDQKNKEKEAILMAESDRRVSKRKISSNPALAKEIPYNSRRRNTRLAASLMVELPNPSYQHSTTEPQKKRQKRK